MYFSFLVFPTSDVGLSGNDPRRGRCQGGDEEEGDSSPPQSDRHLEISAAVGER